MGKTLRGIITTIVGVVEIGVGVITGNPLLIASGIATAAGGIASLLAKIPKPPATSTARKDPRPARVSAYGESRLYGASMLYITNDDGYAVDVWAFHDGRIDGIIQYYDGDKRVRLSGGVVQALPDGTFKGDSAPVVYMGSNLGQAVETAHAAVISYAPDHWSTDHRGDGIVSGYRICRPVKTKNYSKVYSTGGPNQTQMSLAGRWSCVFDWRDSSQSVGDPRTWKWSANAVLHTAHYMLVRMAIGPLPPTNDPNYWTLVASLYAARWNAFAQPTIDYWTAAANDADMQQAVTMVQAALTVEADPDSDHTLVVNTTNGLTAGMTIYLAANNGTDQAESIVVQSVSGNTITLASEVSKVYGAGSGVRWYADSTHPIYEPRYQSCVAHQHTDAHKDVLAHLLACFDGWISPRGDNAIVIYPGRYVAPTDEPLGVDEIISWHLQEAVPEENVRNSLKVTYVSAAHDYNTVDTDDWSDEDDIVARGKLLPDDLDNQVPSWTQARRLAKRALAGILAPYRGTLVCRSEAKRIIGKRYIPILIEEAGATFFDGVGEVKSISRDLTTGQLTIEWVAADPNIDEWNPATEDGLPAPIGAQTAGATLVAPTITNATANFGTDSATGVAGVFIDIVGTGPDRDDIIWYVRTRQAGFETWGTREYDDVAPGTSIEIATEFVPADASIEVQISYQTGTGANSDWSTTATVSTSSANIAPPKVTGFTVKSNAVGQATASYNAPNSTTLAYEKVYRSASNTFSSATLVDTYADPAGTAGSHTFSEPTGATRYYWCTTVSSGGVEGNPVGPVGPITIM